MIQKFDDNTALLIIDVQKGVNDTAYYGGPNGQRNNLDAEANQRQLLEAWRALGGLVVFTCHDSIEPNSPLKLSLPTGGQLPGLEIHDGEIKIVKDVNSGFIGTDLEIKLRRHGIFRLIIAGFFTNMCVETTTRMAGNLGYDSYLVHDACAAMNATGPNGQKFAADVVHDMAVANLHGEFCTAIDTREALTLMKQDLPGRDRAQGNEP